MGKKPAQPSFFGWLGRQIGHVQKAVQADQPPTTLPASPAKPVVIYRKDRVEEQTMPDQPGVKLRRTVIDEVIVEPSPAIADERVNPPKT